MKTLTLAASALPVEMAFSPACTGGACHLWLAGHFNRCLPTGDAISHDKHDKQA